MNWQREDTARSGGSEAQKLAVRERRSGAVKEEPTNYNTH